MDRRPWRPPLQGPAGRQPAGGRRRPRTRRAPAGDRLPPRCRHRRTPKPTRSPGGQRRRRPSRATMVVTLEPCNHVRPHRTVRPGDHRRRDQRRRLRRRRPPRPGGRRSRHACARRASASGADWPAERRAGAEPALVPGRRRPAALRHPAHRADPGQPHRGQRRHQPVDLQPGVPGGQPRHPGPDRRHPGRHPDRAGGQPPPDRPERRRRSLRQAAAARRHGTTATCPTTPPSTARTARSCTCATRDPREALDQLFDSGVRHLMVEGGSRILSAFLAAGLVDELIVYLAPTLLGSGTPALDDLGIGTLADAQQLGMGRGLRRRRPDPRQGPAAAPAPEEPPCPAPGPAHRGQHSTNQLHPIHTCTAPARTPPQEATDVYRNYRRTGKGAVR